MAVTTERREELSKQFGNGTQDSGSAAVQVAIFTDRIKELTAHLATNPKDYATRRGLIMLVGKRRSMLNYYKKHHTPEQYKTLLDSLGLRK